MKNIIKKFKVIFKNIKGKKKEHRKIINCKEKKEEERKIFYCKGCSYYRVSSIRYNVNKPFCVKYLQPIDEINVCNKVVREKKYVKRGNYERIEKNEYWDGYKDSRSVNSRLKEGYRMMGDDEDI